MTGFDVCVIGGGPAGCAAALTLARYTRRRVCLIEASDYGERRSGETVSAALAPLLDYLGAAGILDEASCLPAYGHAAAWGSDRLVERDLIFSGGGPGLHLDRRRFDRAFAQRLAEHGVTVLRRVQAREVLREGEGWRIHAEGAGPIAAHSIVDASGRQSRIARRLGAERRVADRLAALVCHVALPAEPIAATTLVESVAAGWWYSAPLPGNQAVVALMTDADLLRGLAVGDAADFLARLAATRHVGSRLAGARLVDGPHSCTARSQQLDPPLGPGWVAAGDAACAFDPLASLGIGHALGSGIQAARIAHQRLGGDDSLARAYAGDIARHFAMHAAQSRSIYAAERRWPEAPFWRRRH